jgi:hypothetical protein
MPPKARRSKTSSLEAERAGCGRVQRGGMTIDIVSNEMGHVYIPQLLETDLSCFAALSGPETGK